MKKLIYLISILISLSVAHATEQDSLFLAAQKQYHSGNFAKAYLLFDGLIKEGYHSGNLYYNFANTCFEVGDIAKAIAYYEKALKLQPEDMGVKNNLRYARKELGMDEEKKEGLLPIWFKKNIYIFTFWFFWGALFLTAFYFIQNRGQKSRRYKLFLIVLASITILLVFQSIQTYLQQRKVFAIVQGDLHIHQHSTTFSPEVYEVFAGQKIEVMQSKNGWVKIKADGGKPGWIPSYYLIEI